MSVCFGKIERGKSLSSAWMDDQLGQEQDGGCEKEARRVGTELNSTWAGKRASVQTIGT
jgi:hypothetical protein